MYLTWIAVVSGVAINMELFDAWTAHVYSCVCGGKFMY